MNTPRSKIINDLLPSFSALYWYAVVAFVVVVAHSVRLTQQSGTLLPNLLGEESAGWAMTFSQAFINPWDALLSGASLFPVVITALIWGLAGLFFYKGALAIVGFFSEAISSERSVSLSPAGGVVRHSTRRFFWLHVAWQSFVVLMFIVTLVLLPKILGPILAQDILLTQASTVWQIVQHGLTAMLGWMVLFHWFILLVRFFRFFYVY